MSLSQLKALKEIRTGFFFSFLIPWQYHNTLQEELGDSEAEKGLSPPLNVDSTAVSQACQAEYHVSDTFKAISRSGEDARFRLGFIFGFAYLYHFY